MHWILPEAGAWRVRWAINQWTPLSSGFAVGLCHSTDLSKKNSILVGARGWYAETSRPKDPVPCWDLFGHLFVICLLLGASGPFLGRFFRFVHAFDGIWVDFWKNLWDDAQGTRGGSSRGTKLWNEFKSLQKACNKLIENCHVYSFKEVSKENPKRTMRNKRQRTKN